MISEYMIVQVDDKYTCINKNNDYSNIIGGVFTSPTAALVM